jgi:hypothetical protein
MSEEGRLPTKLWIDAVLLPLAGRGIYHYVHQEGDYSTGLILLKLEGLDGTCRLLTQQRDFMSNTLEWVPALSHEDVASSEADAYIARAVSRDPDLWVIEIEDREKKNPFEG